MYRQDARRTRTADAASRGAVMDTKSEPWVPGGPASSWLVRPSNQSLGSVVECFWGASDNPRAPMVLPPAATNDVVFNLVPPTVIERPGVRFDLQGDYGSGVRTTFFHVDQGGEFSLVGIRFRPWVFSVFFGRPPGDSVDRFRPLELGASWARSEVLGSSPGDAAGTAARLEAFLLGLRPWDDPVHDAFVRVFEDLDTEGTVAGWAQRVGTSVSTLERLFRRHIGVSPRTLLRVKRHQRVWNHLHAHPDQTWTELLSDLGYFDQSHFIREFKAFTGKTPQDYLAQRNSTLDRYRLFDENVQSGPPPSGHP